MDETEIEGEPLPRYRLFLSDAKHQPIGEAVCQSDHLDVLRVFPRKGGRRYVLYDRKNRIPVDENLHVDQVTDFKSDKRDGSGWYCKNPKCNLLIAPATALPKGETLVHITCPHCHHPGHYFYSDFGWKKWRAR
jgi:hypothetical protein